MTFFSEYILPVLLVLLASFCFCIIFNIRGHRFFVAAGGGMLGWIVYLATSNLGLSVGDIPQYFFAAIAVSLFSEIMARVTRVPATVYLVISLIPLVPGNSIYSTMESCISGSIDLFLEKLVYTFTVAGSIALGVFLVSSTTKLVTVAANKIKCAK